MSDWTVDTLKEYFDTLRSADQEALRTALDGSKTATDAALAAAEKATSKAEIAADKRFEAVNEFRAQLADQAATLISRAEAEARIDAIGERSELQITQLNAMVGSMGSRLDRNEGRGAGLNAGWGYLVGVMGVLLAIAALAVALLK